MLEAQWWARKLSGLNLIERAWRVEEYPSIQHDDYIVCNESSSWDLKQMVDKCNYYWQFECGLTLEQSCDCGTDCQTMEYITSQCYMQRFREGFSCLRSVSDNRFTVLIFQHNYFVLVIKRILPLNVDNVNSSKAICFILRKFREVL